jgi:SAM-dependent methyltransferase
MPTLEWLRQEFHYGYDSGNILSRFPNSVRRREERKCGGSYRNIFLSAILPYIKGDSVVLEIGPGKGAWSRAILKYLPHGQLHTVDFQDSTKWLKPKKYGGRLVCHQISGNDYYARFYDHVFDFCWSFGVLCHNNLEDIGKILRETLPKLKCGGVAVHQYGDWDMLEKFGWARGGVPPEFKHMKDEDIWWPRNSRQAISTLAEEVGWTVVTSDLGLMQRDPMIVLRRQ